MTLLQNLEANFPLQRNGHLNWFFLLNSQESQGQVVYVLLRTTYQNAFGFQKNSTLKSDFFISSNNNFTSLSVKKEQIPTKIIGLVSDTSLAM